MKGQVADAGPMRRGLRNFRAPGNFLDIQLRNYFNSQWWTPRRNEIPAGEFNKYENYNIKSLHNYE